MSDPLLHENATVQCTHTGSARPMTTNPKVSVGGQKIVTQDVTYQLSGCTLPTQSGGPCQTAQFTDAATKVRAGGKPVLLSSNKAKCVPTAADLNVISTQRKVTAT